MSVARPAVENLQHQAAAPVVAGSYAQAIKGGAADRAAEAALNWLELPGMSFKAIIAAGFAGEHCYVWLG